MLKDLFSKARLAGLALVTTAALTAPASAATIDFVVDRDASSVSLTQSGGGIACYLSTCGVGADLAAGLTNGSTYTIGTGDIATFDFLTFTGTGTTGFTPRSIDVSATLAFSSPSLSVAGSAAGSAFLLFGQIISGALTWNSITPQNFTLPNGSEVAFDFQGGSGLFLGRSVTTTASIVGTSVVPLPAGGLLLIGAIGGLAALRRRKAA